MTIFDSLSDPSVRKTLNGDPNFERLRYLVVLAASTEPPFETSGVVIEGRTTFNVKQLWRVATRLGLEFERFRGAERVFKQLERSGLVNVFRNEQTGFHTQYCPSELGVSQTVLNLDRLRKIQEFESQAKTMQMTIKKQLAKPLPTVLEITLGEKAFTIGKGDENDLCVDDPYISRRHVRIAFESGEWIFQDLNSKNGSWKIEPNNLRRIAKASLADGDMYQLGSTVFRFRKPQA
jgi:hypothetical protein